MRYAGHGLRYADLRYADLRYADQASSLGYTRETNEGCSAVY